MGTSMKTTKTKTSANKSEDIAIDKINESTEETVIEEVKKAEPIKSKKFSADDMIPCRSITSGKLLMVGEKSKFLYTWADRNDVQDVEYQDLIYAVRSANNGFINKPRFIIEDEDFINQNPKVKELYASMYTTRDLKDVLLLPIDEMREAIVSMPEGAIDSLKNIASTMISNGSLDSVKKIKLLDSIFNTNFTQMAELA